MALTWKVTTEGGIEVVCTPGAYSIKLYGSVNYGFIVTAKF